MELALLIVPGELPRVIPPISKKMVRSGIAQSLEGEEEAFTVYRLPSSWFFPNKTNQPRAEPVTRKAKVSRSL